MKRTRAFASVLIGGVSGLAIAAGALAPTEVRAQAGDEIAVDDRVVVTARRREESFIEIPAAVTAYTRPDIESAGITTARDYIALTPNVTLVETQNAGNAFVVIRGISQARNSEPSVAVIIDGVQQTNPSQFSQELVDIQQIEVLRGPQGALYGRNAIGGAINITTRGPTETWESTVLAGVDNGFGYRLQARASGPLADKVGFAGGVSWRDTDGYLENEFLGEEADPAENLAARARVTVTPNDEWSVDLRASFDLLDTQALYFVIDPAVYTGGSGDANNTSVPITVNNRGENIRDIYGLSMQTERVGTNGTFTATTSWDSLEEVLTGDAFDFRPIEESFFFTAPPAFGGLGVDLNQSQFLDVQNFSQEFRFASPDDQPVRYIAGLYGVWTDRFISTGNMVDTGAGVYPVYREPSVRADNPQATYLSDSQDNFAWAVFGDVTWDMTEQLELSVSARYDKDKREQTTETPAAFLTGLPSATSGEVRDVTFEDFQPKVTLSYTPTADFSVYAGFSRGFRSGGFNQSGVGDAAQAAGIVGVGDIFEAETANTWEAGFKSAMWDGRLRLNGAAYYTTSKDSYFFVFLASNSTQNLGNIDEVEYMGFELDGALQLTDAFSVNFGVGYTDSEITEFPDPSVIGNQAPLVSEYTLNLGAQYYQPLGDNGLALRLRADYQRIGDTWWEPYNNTVRNPVDLVDLRAGIEGEDWALTLWSKNAFDEEYNAEFSPGGFLFKALPRRYGVELSKTF